VFEGFIIPHHGMAESYIRIAFRCMNHDGRLWMNNNMSMTFYLSRYHNQISDAMMRP
jgi:hypothetical protein